MYKHIITQVLCINVKLLLKINIERNLKQIILCNNTIFRVFARLSVCLNEILLNKLEILKKNM